jgi:hypothetical protein
VTVDVEMLAIDGLLSDRVTVTPPEGAGVPRVTGNAVPKPVGWMERLDGRLIVSGLVTVTLAVVSAALGSALA